MSDLRDARLDRAEQATAFRSVRDRGAEDQAEAVRRGYDSVEQLAIDELGRAYHELEARITALEQPAKEE